MPSSSTQVKKRAADASRPSLPAHLPRHEIEIAPDICACTGCGGALHRIGEDRAERLDIIPAQYRVLVTVRPKMGSARAATALPRRWHRSTSCRVACRARHSSPMC